MLAAPDLMVKGVEASPGPGGGGSVCPAGTALVGGADLTERGGVARAEVVAGTSGGGAPTSRSSAVVWSPWR